MVDSSEKVSFCVDMQCSSLRVEAFLVFDRGSQPTLGQQITDMLPTVGRQSADKRPTVGRQFFGGAVLHFFRHDWEQFLLFIYIFCFVFLSFS